MLLGEDLGLPPDRLHVPSIPAETPVERERDWLIRFHAGDRETLESCYRDNFAVAERAIGPMLRGVDRETVIHELFSQILGAPDLRRSFHGGSFAAWIATVARNRAIDFARRLRREVGIGDAQEPESAGIRDWTDAAEARLLIERFRRDHLPEEWLGVFELRFLQHLPQREAAKRLSMHRTTLAYREIRIRRMLREFLIEEDAT